MGEGDRVEHGRQSGETITGVDRRVRKQVAVRGHRSLLLHRLNLHRDVQS
jgi:hypothetical protein